MAVVSEFCEDCINPFKCIFKLNFYPRFLVNLEEVIMVFSYLGHEVVLEKSWNVFVRSLGRGEVPCVESSSCKLLTFANWTINLCHLNSYVKDSPLS